MIDLGLTKDTYDLIYESNDLALVSKLDALEQNLKQRLSLYLNEWFLDVSEGINWFDDVLVKNPNIPSIESIVKARILDTEYVTELLEFQGTYNASERGYSVTFKVQSIYGEVALSLSIF